MANYGKYNRQALINRRKELKMSQRALAEKSGVSYGTIQAYEYNKFQPSNTEKLAKICAALDMPISDVIDSIEIKSFQSPVEFQLARLRNGLDQNLSSSYGRQASALFAMERLNEDGQKKAIELLELLCKIPDYKA